MLKYKYRIVTDVYLGYEAQVRYWWFPFWMQLNMTNTHPSVEAAERYIEKYKKSRKAEVVKYIEE